MATRMTCQRTHTTMRVSNYNDFGHCARVMIACSARADIGSGIPHGATLVPNMQPLRARETSLAAHG